MGSLSTTIEECSALSKGSYTSPSAIARWIGDCSKTATSYSLARISLRASMTEGSTTSLIGSIGLRFKEVCELGFYNLATEPFRFDSLSISVKNVSVFDAF